MLTKSLISRWLSEVDDGVCKIARRVDGMKREIADMKKEIAELKSAQAGVKVRVRKKPVAEEKRIRTKRDNKCSGC